MNRQIKITGLLISAVLFMVSDSFSSDTVYSTSRIKRLAELTGIDKTIKNDSVKDFCKNFAFKGHEIRVVKKDGIIITIGEKLFPDNLKKAIPSPVYDFLERFCLERLVGMGLDVSENPVCFDVGDFKILGKVAADSAYSFSLSHPLGNKYVLTWTDQEGVRACRISFPSSYVLLKGTDMLEYESRLPRLLESAKQVDGYGNPASPLDDELSPTANPLVFKSRGKFFSNNTLSNSRHYIRNCDGSFKLLCNSLHPKESLGNIFIVPEMENSFVAKIHIEQYRRRHIMMTIPLSRLLGFFDNEGCSPFFGVMDYDERSGDITGLVEMRNEQYSYFHALKVKMNKKQFDTLDGELDIYFISYVPTHFESTPGIGKHSQ